MEMSFSRGFSPGWLQGCDHKMLVPGESSAKRGVLLGHVQAIYSNRVRVKLSGSLIAGDGVVFASDRSLGAEQGGRIYEVVANATDTAELKFGHGVIDFGRLHVGQGLWKTDDPQLNRRLRKTYQSGIRRQVPLDITVTCQVGAPLRVVGAATNGARCDVSASTPLEKASQHVTTPELLRSQLGRLGKTTYQLRELHADLTSEPMVPLSVLGKIRRQMVEQLSRPVPRAARNISTPPILPALRQAIPQDTAPGDSRCYVLCRNLEQLRAASELNIAAVYAEFQDIREYDAAVAIAQEQEMPIFLATPRIQKPGEMGIFRALEKHAADGFLVRNDAGLRYFHKQGRTVIADFSMNVANELTAQYFMDVGCERVTASYDLNRDQLLGLVTAVPSAWLEVVMHQHMPMFHMEHCVFCAVLSPGTNKTNCGRPCDTHDVELRDRQGAEHPLTADVGCRNTLYNAVPQSSAEISKTLLKHGVRHFRIELLREDAPQTVRTVATYQRLFAGAVSGKEVWQTLRAMNRVGVTRGTLETRDPLAII